MGQEIEHKFKVRLRNLPHPLPRGEKFFQGYLSTGPVVRVRLIINGRRAQGMLTIKGPGRRVRAEYEYPIPAADARKLLKLCAGHVIEKTRRIIGPWELDEFHGKHKGLWLAEVELKTTRQRVPPLPIWVGEEVTGDSRYSNSSLALKGMPAKL